VHTYLTPLPPDTGDTTEQLTDVPVAYAWLPTPGTGLPYADATVRLGPIAAKLAVTVADDVTVRFTGFVVPARPPPLHPVKLYPVFGTACSDTTAPDTYQPPDGVIVTVPHPVGLGAVTTWYCVCHCHVSVESAVIVNAAVVPLPLPADPVPVHPVHTYLTPVAPDTGESTVHVTAVPCA
jgi:hypothetical protein